MEGLVGRFIILFAITTSCASWQAIEKTSQPTDGKRPVGMIQPKDPRLLQVLTQLKRGHNQVTTATPTLRIVQIAASTLPPAA